MATRLSQLHETTTKSSSHEVDGAECGRTSWPPCASPPRALPRRPGPQRGLQQSPAPSFSRFSWVTVEVQGLRRCQHVITLREKLLHECNRCSSLPRCHVAGSATLCSNFRLFVFVGGGGGGRGVHGPRIGGGARLRRPSRGRSNIYKPRRYKPPLGRPGAQRLTSAVARSSGPPPPACPTARRRRHALAGSLASHFFGQRRYQVSSIGSVRKSGSSSNSSKAAL